MGQDTLKDKTRGCLMAGAAGDALGYEVEFMSRRSILSRFGEMVSPNSLLTTMARRSLAMIRR